MKIQKRRSWPLIPFRRSKKSDAASRRAAFEEEALPCLTQIYNGALRLTRDTDAANDLVQETYLRAYASFSSYRRGTNCKAWLFKIMYTIFINEYRRRQRQPQMLPDDELERLFSRSLADSHSADTIPASQSDLSKDVENALNQLPEEYRMALIMVDMEELSYEEAASAMGCPIGTIRSRLFRARKMLFISLKEYARSEGYLSRDHENENEPL